MSNWKRIAAVAGVSLAAISGATLTGITSAGATTLGRVAGYSSAGPSWSAAVTFVVPTLTCTPVKKKGFQAVLAGVRLDASSGSTGGGAALVCAGKTAVYQPLIEINGTAVSSDITVSPGDTVSASATETASSASVTLTDGSQTQTSTGSGATITGEDVGDIAVNCLGTSCAPVPDSTKTSFSAASIDGLNLQAAGGVRANLADAANKVEIKASALSAGNTAFKTTWVMSCGLGAARC
jgi:hypothetical protein